MNFDELAARLADPNSILSTIRGRQVLALIASADSGVTLREIQKNLSLSYYQSYTTVNRLEDEGVAEHVEGEKHSPGVRATYFYHAVPGVKENLELLLNSSFDPENMSPMISEQSQGNSEVYDYSDNPLMQRLKETRQSTRSPYLNILKLIGEKRVASMNDIAEQLGLRPQNVHSKLSRLLELNVLERSKDLNEFQYRLASDIQVAHIDQLLQNLKIDTPLERIREAFSPMTTLESSEQQSRLPVPSNKIDLAETLARKLPDFDPSWTSEEKVQWRDWYDSLIQLSKDSQQNK